MSKSRHYGTHISALKPENVKCIGYYNGSFYVSEYLWNSFADVMRETSHELTWIGSPGWFAYDECKCVYEWIAVRYDLTRFSEGEWMLIGIGGQDDAAAANFLVAVQDYVEGKR